VDLRDVGAGTEGTTADRRTRDPVTDERDLGIVRSGRGRERLDVRAQVRIELVGAEIDERTDGLEPLVVIDDEDRQRRADRRPEEHASPWRARDVRVRLQLEGAVTAHLAGGVDPGIALRMALLTEEEHVVPGRSPDLDDPSRGHVGPRALQEPAVPHEDPHVPHARARPAGGGKAERNV
jgi:hypothetical protein